MLVTSDLRNMTASTTLYYIIFFYQHLILTFRLKMLKFFLISETRQLPAHPVPVLSQSVCGQVCVPGVGPDPDLLWSPTEAPVQVRQQEVQ